MVIALFERAFAAGLLGVLVRQPQCLADFGDHILIWSRIVTARRLVAYGVGRLGVGFDVAASECGARCAWRTCRDQLLTAVGAVIARRSSNSSGVQSAGG